jgi:hypothetical protein
MMQRAVRDQAKAASDQMGEITKQTEAIVEQTRTASLQIHEIVAQTQAVTNQTQAIANQTTELIYQRRLSILPKFSVGFSRRQPPFPGKIFDCLELVNIGNGTAVNVSVDDIEVKYETDASACIRFGKFLFIEPTKSSSKIDKVAPIPLFIDNENNINYDSDDFDAFVKAEVPEQYRDEPTMFLQKHANEKRIAILVRFQDIDGTRYKQSAILGLDQDKPYPLELGVPTMENS